uniref:NR LBD domain-containing protein n=1 Tax=Meloidogyne enterolobii TaxID=390850 RepID=A0A6V7TWI9_MELEN|nr:unnamed protein product [Meloidogyne enterolobii]
MEFCKYRSLTKVVDYINYLSLINLNEIMEKTTLKSQNSFLSESLSVQDKIVLLRYGFAPLVLFDIAFGTISVTKDTQNLLCLPTGITLCAGETIVPNSFLTQQIVSKSISSLVRLLDELKMDQEEFILMKLIIVLGMDSASGEDNNEGGGGGEVLQHLQQLLPSFPQKLIKKILITLLNYFQVLEEFLLKN